MAFSEMPIISKPNVDVNGNPQLIQVSNETHEIFKSKIVLNGIPDKFSRITITDEDNVAYVEVFDTDVLTGHQFKVNYSNGVINFPTELEGWGVVVSYYSKGVELISAERIYTKLDDNGDLSELLSDKIDEIEILKTNYDNAVHMDIITKVKLEYTATQDVTSFVLDVNNYNPLIDMVFLYLDGITLIEGEQYVLTGTTVTLVDWVLSTGKTIDIVVERGVATIPPAGTNGGDLMNGSVGETKLSADVQLKLNKTLVIQDYRFTATVDNTTNFTIAGDVFNANTDTLDVYKDREKLIEDTDYSLSEQIVTLSVALNIGQFVDYRITKNTSNSVPLMPDGSLLQNRSVPKKKLTQTLQDEITKATTNENEIISARKTKASLRAKIDDLDTKDNDLQSQITVLKNRLDSIYIDVTNPPSTLSPCLMDGTNDIVKLQAIHDYIVDNYDCGEIYIKSGTMTIKDTFTWDVGKVKIKCNGKILVDISDNTKYAISTINSTTNDTYRQSRIYCNGLELTSKTQNACNGILFNGGTGNIGASHIKFENCVISNFNKALSFGNHAYLIKFYSCDIHTSYLAINVMADTDDSGENIKFTDCTIFNNRSAIQNSNPYCDLYFQGCSLDYNWYNIVTIDKGQVRMDNCHIEHNALHFNLNNRPFILKNNDGNFLSITNSLMSFIKANINDPTTMDYVFQNDLITSTSANSGIYIDNCFFDGLFTTTGFMATGGLDNNTRSITIIKNTKAWSWKNLSYHTSQSMNLFYDPMIWNADMTNAHFCSLITNDETDYALLANKFVGTNLEVFASFDQGYYGGNCIGIRKKGLPQKYATYTIVVPVSKLQFAGCTFRVKSTNTDTIDVYFGFCNFDGKRIYDADRKFIGGQIGVNPTYQYYTMPNMPYKNDKAYLNYAFLDIVLYNTQQNNIVYIDDIFITEM